MLKQLTLSMAALTLFACETIPTYHPAGSLGDSGFSDQKISDNQYRVTFQGDASTPRHKVEDYLLFRAAELTQEKGDDYFVVIDKETSEKTTVRTIRHLPTIGRFSHYWDHYYYEFPYYAYGYDWGYPYDLDMREYTRYSASAYIETFKGQKPADNTRAFQAQDVIDNLSPVECWKTEPHDEGECKLSHQ